MTIISTVLDELRTRRAAKAEHKRLLEELSSYRRPSEIDDLMAAVNRYDERETAQVRAILERNLAA